MPPRGLGLRRSFVCLQHSSWGKRFVLSQAGLFTCNFYKHEHILKTKIQTQASYLWSNLTDVFVIMTDFTYLSTRDVIFGTLCLSLKGCKKNFQSTHPASGINHFVSNYSQCVHERKWEWQICSTHGSNVLFINVGQITWCLNIRLLKHYSYSIYHRY